MAKPEISWPQDKPSPETMPRMGWVRWLIAGLILMTLALASHTSGRAARLIMANTQHWIETSTHVPAGAHLGSLSLPMPKGIASPAAKTVPHWISPVASARLVQSFGWQGTGAKARFNPAATIKAGLHAPVEAGMMASVVRVSRTAVEVRANGYLVDFKGIAPAALHKGQRVQPTTVIGHLRSRELTLGATKDGYPVNPLGSALFGAGWIRH
ncbi:hypothetical protein [Sulfobacillus harzensis]|uniref:Uncharacterized protein n=1 Tax=Sulfobacillus harzensis TaxID=2729629 RepID=A0A7Y0L3J6_9FIRM|nr:hypothetical protein [Sulfobacillus harzensis]NMP21234.1 hypothetical protein [Sulfobacillus harzensis]